MNTVQRRPASRILKITALLIVLVCFIPPAAVNSHSPVFPSGNHSPTTAYQLDDATKSWAIYTHLSQPGIADYYTFSRTSGQQIELSLITPLNPAQSGFLPSLALLVPGSNQHDRLPGEIAAPTDYGTMVVNGSDPGHATYEPFAPGWYYELAHLIIAAPADGTYFVVVFDRTDRTASYGLPIGYLESFTPLEIILVPYHLQMVYLWEGQSLFFTVLPFVVVLVLGGLILFRRSKHGETPNSRATWLAGFAGLAFLGAVANTFYQMLLALSVTGFRAEAFVTLGFAAIGIVLGVLTLGLSLRASSPFPLWQRGVLFSIAVVGLFGWAGLYLGPVLALMAAVMPNELDHSRS